ncbi:hypothetical protein HYU21_03515, partial [Candidatus Woesearchaeota archaeon]|nr:hypothetical protein [Candidatus Woesearchaeota archaeon]
MAKTKVVGLVIILIMFLSVLASGVFYQNPQQAKNQDTLSIPQDGVFDRELQNWERDILLSNGISVFEYSYSECNQDCVQKIADLRSFVLLSGAAVLSVYQSDGDVMQFIGKENVPLENTSQKYLEDVICEKGLSN